MNTGDPWGDLMSSSINASIRRQQSEADDLAEVRSELHQRWENSFRDLATHTGLTEAIFRAVVKAHYDQWKTASSKFPGDEADARQALEALIAEGRRRFASGTTYGDLRKEAEHYKLPQG